MDKAVLAWLGDRKGVINAWAERWRSYYTGSVTNQLIAVWLAQFGELPRIELAWRLLERLHFLDHKELCQLLDKALSQVPRKDGESSSYPLLVPLGRPNESGAHILYDYAKSTRLHDSQLRTLIFTTLSDALDSMLEIKGPLPPLALVDDNTTSGTQFERFLQEVEGTRPQDSWEFLDRPLREDQRNLLTRLPIYLAVACELGDARTRIRSLSNDMGLDVRIVSGMSDTIIVFGETSDLWHDASSILVEEFKDFCREVGRQTLRAKGFSQNRIDRDALGAAGQQKLTVFYFNIPKPTLTILWAAGNFRGKPWIPLFLERAEFWRIDRNIGYKRYLSETLALYPEVSDLFEQRGPRSDYRLYRINERLLAPIEGPIMSNEFEPTLEEYKDGRVSVSQALVLRLDEQLQNDRECLVLGDAASGKTTLAYSYGLRHEAKGGIVFYVDCKDYQDSWVPNEGQLLSALRVWTSPQLFLIIDNVHLIPDRLDQLRKSLLRLQVPDGRSPSSESFSVLYLGRRLVMSDSLSASMVSRMEALGRTLTIEADKQAFRAVYNRLALRHGVPPPPLPDACLEQWLTAFTSDLIFFSFAANSYGQGLATPDLGISPEAALSKVRERYLDPLKKTPSAWKNMLTLASLAELELWGQNEAFEVITPSDSPFEWAVKQGIVYQTQWKQWYRYNLPHPSLGSLILRAAPAGSPQKETLIAEASRRSPHFTVTLLWKLYAADKKVIARSIEKHFLDPAFLASCVKELNANQWYRLLRHLNKNAPETFSALKGSLTQQVYHAGIVSQLVETPLHLTIPFFEFIGEELPALGRALQSELRKNRI